MAIRLLRWNLRRTMFAVAVLAIPLSWIGALFGERRSRCLEIASRLRSTENAYRAHGINSFGSKRLADWNEHLRLKFEKAATRPWEPIPDARAIPPPNFK